MHSVSAICTRTFEGVPQAAKDSVVPELLEGAILEIFNQGVKKVAPEKGLPRGFGFPVAIGANMIWQYEKNWWSVFTEATALEAEYEKEKEWCHTSKYYP